MFNRALTKYLRHVNRSVLSFGEASNEIRLPVPAPDRKYLLYIHIPFCEVLCPFCSFHRVKFEKTKSDRYFEALRAEIGAYQTLGFEFSEIYVGGGTPTVDLQQLTTTLDLARSLFDVTRVSVETNPIHLRPKTIDTLLHAGVNRLSVGVQSFDDRLLKEMGRHDAYGSGREIRERLQDAGGAFETLNADMIFNIPHQDVRSLERDIEIIRETGVDQVSFYPLMTATSARHRMRRTMGEVEYAREEQYYYLIDDAFADYTQSSVWCFSKSDAMIDEYIVDHEEYVGVGSGAFSYLDGCLYATSFSILRYDEIIDRGKVGITRARRFNRHERLQYHFMTALFGLTLDKAEARRRFGNGYFRELAKEIWGVRLLGGLRDDGERLRLTRRGRYIWVVMMREFFTGVNNFRDQMRAHIREEYEASYDLPVPVEILEYAPSQGTRR